MGVDERDVEGVAAHAGRRLPVHPELDAGHDRQRMRKQAALHHLRFLELATTLVIGAAPQPAFVAPRRARAPRARRCPRASARSGARPCASPRPRARRCSSRSSRQSAAAAPPRECDRRATALPAPTSCRACSSSPSGADRCARPRAGRRPDRASSPTRSGILRGRAAGEAIRERPPDRRQSARAAYRRRETSTWKREPKAVP